MDKKLLNALNNLSDSLEEISSALKEKNEMQSDTATALKSGNIGENLKQISVDIKSIKVDTQEILKKQDTIISLSKEKEGKDEKTLKAAGDKESISKIKEGVASIMLIAGAVLALGAAFSLVGDVDIASVIGLSLAIVILAESFKSVVKTLNETGFNAMKDGTNFFLSTVLIAAAITTSSWILSTISSISIAQILTAIGIGAGFAVISKHVVDIIKEFSDIGMGNILKSVISLPLVMTAISLGIAASSWALRWVSSLSMSQFTSAILVSGILAVVSFGVRNMLRAFKGLGPKTLIQASLFLPLVLPAISLGIAASSWALQLVQPISMGQFFTSLLIGAAFFVLSFSIRRIMTAFRGIDPKTAATATLTIPLILTAMSYAIKFSSEALAGVVPITMQTFITAIAISVIFIPLAFAANLILASVNKMKMEDVFKIPIFFVAMSTAITLSSMILDNAVIVDSDRLINAGLIGAGLAILTMALANPIRILSKIDIVNILKGALAIPIIATAIMVSSWILSVGNYENAPPIEWTLGTAAAMIPFAFGMAMLGPLLIPVALGVPAVLLVASTVMLSSHILKEGDYSTYPSIDWSKGVSLSLGTFAAGMAILGGIIFASFGLGLGMLAAGAGAVLMVAKTIVAASDILANGYVDEDGNKMSPNWKDGPTEDWSKGVSIALGAFSPVYGMLMRNAVLSLFGGGGVGPEDFTTAIKTVSKGIVTAAQELGNSDGVWAGGPTKDWAEGVGLAIGAFVPVYEILLANSGWLSSGVSVDDFKTSIKTVSEGIVSAGEFFAKNTSSFDDGNYPSEEWGKGVGSAIGAFVPVYEVLAANSSWISSGVSIPDFIDAIQVVSEGIVSAAEFFAKNTSPFDEGNYPSEEWGKGVGAALGAFSPLFGALSEDTGWFTSGTDVIKNMVVGVIAISGALVNSARAFSGYEYDFDNSTWKKGSPVDWAAYPSTDWAEGVGQAIYSVMDIFDEIGRRGMDVDDFTEKSNVLLKGMVALTITAKILSKNKGFFDFNIEPDFMQNVGKNLLDFNDVVNKLVGSESGGIKSFFDSDPITLVAERMMKLAEGYSALAKSLKEVGASISDLNLDSANELSGITSELITPEKTPSINVPTVEEKESEMGSLTGLFSNFFSKEPEVGDKPFGASVEEPTEDIISTKLDKVIELLSNINTSTGSLGEFIDLKIDDISSDDLI